MDYPAKLSDFQLDFIKKALAIRTPLVKIKQEFQILYESPIRGEVIQAIELKYKEEIKDIARRELNNTAAVAISFSRVRLEYLQRAIEDACTPKIVGSYKVSEPYIDKDGNETTRDVYKPEYAIDHSALKGYLDLAQKEEYIPKRLILEKLAKGINDETSSKGGTPTVTAYTSYDNDEDKVLIDGQAEMDS